MGKYFKQLKITSRTNMGRRRKRIKQVIFCFYCDRDFENEKILIEHQRGKHFKCPICHRRLSSAKGMMIHVFQVHKENIDSVPHSKKGRESLDPEVFGMIGVPHDVLNDKITRIQNKCKLKKESEYHADIEQTVSSISLGKPIQKTRILEGII